MRVDRRAPSGRLLYRGHSSPQPLLTVPVSGDYSPEARGDARLRKPLFAESYGLHHADAVPARGAVAYVAGDLLGHVDPR